MLKSSQSSEAQMINNNSEQHYQSNHTNPNHQKNHRRRHHHGHNNNNGHTERNNTSATPPPPPPPPPPHSMMIPVDSHPDAMMALNPFGPPMDEPLSFGSYGPYYTPNGLYLKTPDYFASIGNNTLPPAHYVRTNNKMSNNHIDNIDGAIGVGGAGTIGSSGGIGGAAGAGAQPRIGGGGGAGAGAQQPPFIGQPTPPYGINTTLLHNGCHMIGSDRFTDIRQMESTLYKMLQDFQQGKTNAFGDRIMFEKMLKVREQQQNLARLHFELNQVQKNDTTAGGGIGGGGGINGGGSGGIGTSTGTGSVDSVASSTITTTPYNNNNNNNNNDGDDLSSSSSTTISLKNMGKPFSKSDMLKLIQNLQNLCSSIERLQAQNTNDGDLDDSSSSSYPH